MKKMVLKCALAAAVLLLSAGCSGSKKTAAGTTADGKLDTSKPVELVLYVISVEPTKQAELNENFNRLAKEKLNCTLKINWIGWAEYANKYPLLFSSGETFDMAYTGTWLNFSALAKKGAFKNLDELLPKYAPNNYARQSKTALQQATVDGHLYAIPTLLPTYSAYGPIYRTEGIELPGWDGKMENFEDMERYLQIVKDNNPMIEPLDIYSMNSEMDEMWMWSRGRYASKGASNDFLWLDPTQSKPQLYGYFDEPTIGDFLTLMNRWNDAGYYSKTALADTDSEKPRNGKSALRLHNIDTFQGYYQDKPEFGWRYANFVSDVSNMAFTQDALVISNTSKNPERALALYDLITSDEEMFRAFFYGIEGKSYELQTNDGQLQVKGLNPEEYAFSALWAARTKEFFLPAVGAPPDLQATKDAFDAYIQDGVKSQKFRSFVPDVSSIETEYAACQNVHQQYWWPLELGYVDAVSGLAEYREKMQAACFEKVRTALQTQLDAYLASL
ncbi:MAG: ABC transporter substrate-binding protein [Treponemataceae bacterium]|nr:MAG: ABC transporter substrate-binding protein [Treponemataceae bacterium]